MLLGVLAAILVYAPAASAALPAYELNPDLSLTADPACQTSTADPVADPGCPYPPPPGGPTERFNEPRAIAFDLYGNEYVATTGGSNARILIFDDEGFFISEFVTSPTLNLAVDSKGNLYTFTTGRKVLRFTPSTYEPEAGKIAYGTSGVLIFEAVTAIGAIAVDRSNDHLLIDSSETIREYGPADEVKPEEANKLIDTYQPEQLGPWSRSMAVDAQRRRIYISFCQNDTEDCGLLVLDADNPEKELEEITGSTTPKGEFVANLATLGIAVDEESGDFFVQDFSVKPGAVYQFGENYEYLSSTTDSRFTTILTLQIAVSNGERPPDGSGEDAFNRHFLFIPMPPGTGSLANRALAYAPPPEVALPPEIEEVSVAGIGETQAQLQALIDPRGAQTTYRFEITTQASFEAEGFAGAKFVGEGTISATALATQVSVPVSGLSPGESYRFRATAKNVVGEAQEEGQNEATFATYEDSLISPDGCANLALRVGPSARLPDCRAYELVTPPDTNGRKPRGVGFIGDTFTTLHTSPAGDKVYFKIEGGSLPGTSGVASFEGDPYVAARGSEGWSTALAGPSGDQATDGLLGSPSPDMGYSFWTAFNEGPLVIEKGLTHYLRYPDGDLELTGRGSIGTDSRAVGRLITEDATHVIFITRNVFPDQAIQLEPDAPPTGTAAVYDRTISSSGAEETHVVSLLPGNETPAAGQNATYVGASKDGEGIAFELSNTLYLRLGNETTYEVGENVDFAGVSEGGERIFYVEGGDLKALDTSSEEVVDFSETGDVTPVNVATEGTRAYFVSPSVLGGTNPQGDSAQAGGQNLYLSEEGAISFVATVTDRDVEGEPLPAPGDDPSDGLGLWTEVLPDFIAKDPSRLNPDGSVLLFQSRANVTGYEESDFAQIYRYDSGEERLHCLSCIPTGMPASGGATLQTVSFNSETPPPLSPSGFIPNLTPSGNRVFFESEEALVSTDSDEVKDVYEWEEAGIGGCIQPGGCLYLISSGASERDNFLYAHSQSGNDVFFSTSDILNGFDGSATPSIYDAKVGGGFAQEEAVPCVDEGCLLPLSSPPVLPAAAQSTPGNDNVQPKPAARSCPKGKRKVKKNGKVRCVKKKKGKSGKANKRAGANRGAGK